MPESVVIINSKLPDGENTATVPARSLHVWEEQGWKVAPKAKQEPDTKS